MIHNVVGGIGVVEGNDGLLRPGLSLQTIHDSKTMVHEALRLSVMIEAIDNNLLRHDDVRQLFDNGRLHLFSLQDVVVSARYRRDLIWEVS